MDKRSLSIAAVFLVGCAVGGVSSQLVVPQASAQQAATLTKWEYACYKLPLGGGDTGDVVREMNRRGAESWELEGAANDGRVCFKRPKT
jgi:hypothetical protein